jgi:CRISPR-associated Cas5-like protein
MSESIAGRRTDLLYYAPWPGYTESGHTPLAFEIFGDYGLFSRVDVSTAVAVSYPFPTWSAIKGMIETIFWRRDVWNIVPLGVEALSPLEFTKYSFAYCGELRKRSQIASGACSLHRLQVLVNPAFRVVFDVQLGPKAKWPRRKCCAFSADLFKKAAYRRSSGFGYGDFGFYRICSTGNRGPDC